MDGVLFMAEQQGFEPWRHFHALRDFESRLFDHLSTAPYLQRAYYISEKRENQVIFAERLDKIQYQMGLPTPEGVGVVKKCLVLTDRIRRLDARSKRLLSGSRTGRTAGFLPKWR